MIIHADPEELVALIERLQGRANTVRIPLEVSGDDLAKAVRKAIDGTEPTGQETTDGGVRLPRQNLDKEAGQ